MEENGGQEKNTWSQTIRQALIVGLLTFGGGLALDYFHNQAIDDPKWWGIGAGMVVTLPLLAKLGEKLKD